MMLVLRKGTDEQGVRKLVKHIEASGADVQYINGEQMMLGLSGDTSQLDPDSLSRFEEVERIIKVKEPYKRANRKFHREATVIDAGGVKIGGKKIAVIAGPCSVESEVQLLNIARQVKRAGASLLRGGAFKPRSSPYAFQGLGLDGLELLKIASRKTGLPIVSEIMSAENIKIFADEVDIIQVGARNMQNFVLLKELSMLSKPILLKRGLSATIEELLMAAEYIMAGGNQNVILCERGIRTFETYTRNTLDLSAVPVLKRESHLPVIVDPSHGTGMWWLVEPMSKAAVAAGADGLIIEVHNDPPHAKCDGQQSLTPQSFALLMEKLGKIAELEGREI
ncbi:MAG: 3-deoxy-7-phosphoheptulonate synthase [Clostridiales bacterium]|nr:3-deoxy-7-phosphoheptulonate synthase [Clostridiales bacterium]